jgi:hypothetical protein
MYHNRCHRRWLRRVRRRIRMMVTRLLGCERGSIYFERDVEADLFHRLHLVLHGGDGDPYWDPRAIYSFGRVGLQRRFDITKVMSNWCRFIHTLWTYVILPPTPDGIYQFRWFIVPEWEWRRIITLLCYINYCCLDTSVATSISVTLDAVHLLRGHDYHAKRFCRFLS